MTILETQCIFGMVSSSLLILMYTKTLFSAYTGSKYKFVVRILVMLLLSNVGTLTGAVADYMFFLKKDYKLGYVWMLALAVALQDSMFCISHWLLAAKYKAISEKVPLIL